MKIFTAAGEYRVTWKPAGFTYAVAVVKKAIPFTLGLLWWKVWDKSTAKKEWEAEEMYPQQMRDWFERAVYEYEKYQHAWEKESANG